MDDAAVLDVLVEALDAVRASMVGNEEWGLSGLRDTQYQHDLIADAAALGVLHSAGFAVVSEESGRSGPSDAPITVVCDPIDGSTNASHAIPWWASSFAAVDADGLVAGVVANLAGADTFTAVRGAGTYCNGERVSPSARTSFDDGGVCAVVGWPQHRLGSAQLRAFGASAFDLCLVAGGRVDAFVDCSVAGNSPWDYLAAVLIIREAGGCVVDAGGRDLVTVDYDAKRWLVAGGTEELVNAVVPLRGPAGPSPLGGPTR